MEWNGGMDWTAAGTVHGMECRKQLDIKAHAHNMVPYTATSLKILVCGAVSD